MSLYFQPEELRCKCGCGEYPMDEQFMGVLDTIREAYGHPIYLSSAYRCPTYDASIGGKGPHTTGKAVDIRISGRDAHAVLKLALENGITGVGVSQKGPHGARFLHLDTITEGTRPWVWSY